ncbi:hypothetical protein HC081234_20040 [Helicobacter cinaedi]|nr:hypothetical protein HC081234_20040 [Helicobacter cinaedi]
MFDEILTLLGIIAIKCVKMQMRNLLIKFDWVYVLFQNVHFLTK